MPAVTGTMIAPPALAVSLSLRISSLPAKSTASVRKRWIPSPLPTTS
jgi:hypothetical protein